MIISYIVTCIILYDVLLKFWCIRHIFHTSQIREKTKKNHHSLNRFLEKNKWYDKWDKPAHNVLYVLHHTDVFICFAMALFLLIKTFAKTYMGHYVHVLHLCIISTLITTQITKNYTVKRRVTPEISHRRHFLHLGSSSLCLCLRLCLSVSFDQISSLVNGSSILVSWIHTTTLIFSAVPLHWVYWSTSLPGWNHCL